MYYVYMYVDLLLSYVLLLFFSPQLANQENFQLNGNMQMLYLSYL